LNKTLRRTLKILGWTVGSIILLLLLVVVWIQTPSGQNFARARVVSFLEKKLGTEVHVDRLSITFPKKIVLEGVYFADQNKDTLIAGEKLTVDIAMFKLLKSKVEINDVELTGIRANIYRKGTDSFFNYDYIVKAFTSPTTAPNPADTTGIDINIRHVRLQKVLTTFRDDNTGTDMYGYIGDFETTINKFDINNFRFDVPDFRLERVIVRAYQHKPLVEPKTVAQVVAENTGAPEFALTLGNTVLRDIDADYGNDVSAITARLKVGELITIPNKIDLQTLQISLNSLVLKKTEAIIALGNTPSAHEVEEQVDAAAKTQAANPWRITINQVDFADNHIKFDNNQRTPTAGMDYAHMDVMDLTLDATDLAITPTEYSGNIEQLAFHEANSEFTLLKTQTAFLYNEHGVQLRDLYLETDKSIIRDNIELAWPNMTVDQLALRPGDMIMKANITNSRLSFRDVLTFAPMLATVPPFYHNENAVFAVSTRLEGMVKDLNIPRFEARGMNTTLVASGRIRGLPDPINTVYALNIAKLNTTNNDLVKLLPAGTIPPTIRLPEAIAANGTFNGSMNAFTTNMKLQTSRGSADVIATMRNMSTYDLNASVAALDLGYIMKQEQTIGKVSGKVNAVGSGFDPATMVATVKMNVYSAYIQGYNYQNLVVDAKLNRGAYTGTATMNDPNISFRMDLAGMMNGAFPSVKGDMTLDSLNLKALGLYSSDLRIHGRMVMDLASTNPDALLGTVDAYNLVIMSEGKRYVMPDTLHIAATEEAGTRRLVVNSSAINAELSGQYKLTEIAQAVQHTINSYYNIPGFRETAFTPQQWTLNATVYPSPFLFSLMPELKGSDSIKAAASYNSAAEDLKLGVGAPRIVYGTNRVDSLTFNAATGTTLNYALSMHSAGNPQLALNHTSLTGDVANNQATANLDVKDAEDKSRYQISATVNQTPNDGFRASLAPNLMLDYENWAVGPNNFIQYDNAGVVVHDFSMSNGTQSIAASSVTDMPSAPINMQFSNFQIGTITKLANQNSIPVDGLINGTAQVRNPTTELVFTSDITVNNLVYDRDTLGDLIVRVNNETSQTLAADIRLQGRGNDVRLDGRYFLADQRMDMNLNMASLSLNSIKPFTAGNLTDASGNLRGQFAVTGTLEKPNVTGSMRFDSAYVTPTLLGERFALTNESIDVNATGIHFNNFTIADSARNTANIDGSLLTTDYKDYKFALKITAEDFRVVNSSRGTTHKPFYGRLNVTTNTSVSGDMNMPIVNSYLRINKNTDFSYVLPANDPEVQSRVGVVEFVDLSLGRDSAIFASGPQDSVTHAGVKGMDVAARIETDSAANFNIIIDERNGDAVHVRGIAALEGGIDKSGKVNLTGTYVMQDGSYLLTFNFLRRQFYIAPGSTITWNGDPTQATVDITARYVANTAPIDLVQHQLAGRSQYEVNQYKQNVPFQVLLRMRGELMKPQITFDIELPEREASRLRDVDAKLAQVRADESEMNKQVFALLLLGHFVDENPLESNGAPSTAESFARQSVSRILTDQLNRIAGNIIKGVDLNFGVNSGNDYSTGELTQRTDLTVGLSKRLLNDRLKVNVGPSFGLEGPTAPNQQASNIAGDVSLDYQLSKDGRYMVRAYRRNNYEGLVEGQVVETGATFIFRIDYDNFKEFFSRPRSK
jgi:hypothetical protein